MVPYMTAGSSVAGLGTQVRSGPGLLGVPVKQAGGRGSAELRVAPGFQAGSIQRCFRSYFVSVCSHVNINYVRPYVRISMVTETKEEKQLESGGCPLACSSDHKPSCEVICSLCGPSTHTRPSCILEWYLSHTLTTSADLSDPREHCIFPLKRK